MPYAEKLEKAALPSVDDIVRVAKRACFRSADPAAQRAAA
jgi:pyruvate dehydrogenase E1 component beta subunit